MKFNHKQANLSNIQANLGDIQANLGDIQANLGDIQANLVTFRLTRALYVVCSLKWEYWKAIGHAHH